MKNAPNNAPNNAHSGGIVPDLVGPVKFKCCATCGERLTLEAFVKCHKNTHARTPYCRPCALTKSKQWELANADRVKELAAAKRRRNADRIKESAAKYREANRESIREKSRAAYRAQDPAARAERYRQRYLRLRAKYRECNKRWAAANPDKVRAKCRRWCRANPAKVAAKCSRRRARSAFPPWACPKAVAKLYAHARALTLATGIPHEVDHILPLSSPDVCGLHVAENLRVIPAVENRSKGNRIVESLL